MPRQDGVALELHEIEVRTHTGDDRVEETPEHRVRGRDAVAEIDTVRVLDTRHEPGVARDVGEQEVALASGRIGHGGNVPRVPRARLTLGRRTPW